MTTLDERLAEAARSLKERAALRFTERGRLADEDAAKAVEEAVRILGTAANVCSGEWSAMNPVRLTISGLDTVQGTLVIEVDKVETEVRLIAEGETIALRGAQGRRVAEKIRELAETCARKGEASPLEAAVVGAVRGLCGIGNAVADKEKP